MKLSIVDVIDVDWWKLRTWPRSYFLCSSMVCWRRDWMLFWSRVTKFQMISIRLPHFRQYKVLLTIETSFGPWGPTDGDVEIQGQSNPIVRIRMSDIVDVNFFLQMGQELLCIIQELVKNGWTTPSCCEPLSVLLISDSSNIPSRHIQWSTRLRRRWCRLPEATRADFRTIRGPLSSLVSPTSSVPAGWP